MSQQLRIPNASTRGQRARDRSGLSFAEVLVSATMMATVMSLVTVSSFRVSRIWLDVHDHRNALNELTNQLDRLTTIPVQNVARAIDSIEASDACREMLIKPRLSGSIENAKTLGRRVTLEITWQNRLGTKSNSTQLSAWHPSATEGTNQ